MYRKLIKCLCLALVMMCALPSAVWAKSAEETLVEFTSSNATMEDNPNAREYYITIFSPDGLWKLQLKYIADSMFGTFTNSDFQLDSSGKYYNYARNPKNDMVFYTFKDMNVTVADEGTLYRVNANCLTTNDIRFVVEATIEAPQPESEIEEELGYAHITTNKFYGTYTIKAENDHYKLVYGLVSDTLLGTFYRADLLMPELHDKQNDKDVKVITATAVHTQQGDTSWLKLDLLSEEHVLYRFTMFNGPHEVIVKEERDVAILSGVVLQDLTSIYGCYQFGGQNDEYAVAIAVSPEAFESGRTEWTENDIFMPYTALIEMTDQKMVDLYSVSASVIRVESVLTLKAEMTSMDGILYHVSMALEAGDVAPEVQDTVYIDFGHVAMLDYTKGIGTVGLGAVKQDAYQMRCYLNTYDLNGTFSNADFLLTMCDIMEVDPASKTYVFHDAKYVTASMEMIDSVIYVSVDMVGVNSILYRATMYIEPMPQEMELPVTPEDGTMMVAIQMGTENGYSDYYMQLQNLEDALDEDDNIVGSGSIVSFYFVHEGDASIAGEYGYSAGTLDEEEYHTIYVEGCEVRVAPVAGTLSIAAEENVVVVFDNERINTCLYSIGFKFLGQNGVIYSGHGQNYLLCIDQDGYWIEMDEPSLSSIKEQLAAQGYLVRKVLKNGQLVIEKDGKQYSGVGMETVGK